MPEREYRRPTPEQLLKQVEAEERHLSRGRLKIFLGYASGVGKSFRMLDEGRRRKLRGQDVVVVATQPSASPDVEELLRSFDVIPPRIEGGRPAIDLPAVLRRHPAVCLIDGLAYQNPPGSAHRERWEDVEELLAAGISVITSVNLQYIKERQREIEAIRGKAVNDSVPEAFIHTADEIELVDAPSEYCVDQSTEGAQPVDVQQFQRRLSELREIALVLAAEVVDHQREAYLQQQGGAPIYATHERILVCVTPRSNTAEMISRGRRQADLFHGDLHAVYVQQDGVSAADLELVNKSLDAARDAKAHVEVLEGEDPVETILDFAAKHGITQIFVGHSQQQGTRWLQRWTSNPLERLIMEADGIDVRIFPNHRTAP